MYASHEEMEDAVHEEYREEINGLEEQAVELHKEIDRLKHEVDVAEAEARQWEKEYYYASNFVAWMQDHHPEILTTYAVTQRLEE